MGPIERYESSMTWVRDGVWVLAVLGAFLGLLGFAEALILGGLAWFTVALIRAAPRLSTRLRPFFAAHWRTINTLLFFQVVTITLIAEAVRTHRLSEPNASTLLVVSLTLTTGLVVRRWKRTGTASLQRGSGTTK